MSCRFWDVGQRVVVHPLRFWAELFERSFDDERGTDSKNRRCEELLMKDYVWLSWLGNFLVTATWSSLSPTVTSSPPHLLQRHPHLSTRTMSVSTCATTIPQERFHQPRRFFMDLVQLHVSASRDFGKIALGEVPFKSSRSNHFNM